MNEKIIYHIYHIPGKKVGVTRNLKERVTTQQGYAVTEYEVLDSSTDIDYISQRELELQQSYGYKVDRKLYKNLFNHMNINATEQTSTFPFPMAELKERLKDNLGTTWETLHGTFKLNKNTVEWIVENARTSMYNNARSYIYNKAFFSKFLDKVKPVVDQVKLDLEKVDGYIFNTSSSMLPSKFELIRNWAEERGLYTKGDTKTQFCKLMEEAGELGRSILKDDQVEFVDAIGDMVVVLTNLAHLGNTSIEACMDAAYDEIKNRTGSMKNGTFVKTM